jgi:hypothetical protein
MASISRGASDRVSLATFGLPCSGTLTGQIVHAALVRGTLIRLLRVSQQQVLLLASASPNQPPPSQPCIMALTLNLDFALDLASIEVLYLPLNCLVPALHLSLVSYTENPRVLGCHPPPSTDCAPSWVSASFSHEASPQR